MTAPVNPALLEAAISGDVRALETLLVVCRPRLLRYAAQTCRASDAEDAVQEALLILHRRLPTLRSAAAFAVWLFRIVKRECLRLERRVGFRASFEGDWQEKSAAYLHAPRNDIEMRLDIAAAIQSLPDLYREVLVLRDFQELTIEEIAVRLGLVPATVKTRLSRGRLLIREHLLS